MAQPSIASASSTSLGFDGIAIPGGSFLMGDDEGQFDERPAHLVRVALLRHDGGEMGVVLDALLAIVAERMAGDRGGAVEQPHGVLGERSPHKRCGVRPRPGRPRRVGRRLT